jgi:hypothetical protein
MMRACALLSLLLIPGVLRAPSFAQEPSPQSPTTKRQSFVEEVMRRRLSLPTITAPVETAEEPVLRIETAVLRLPDPNAGMDKSGSFLENLSGLYETALFQRQRYRETGQPIEFERGNLFFHQDRYVVTKGLILYRIQNDRIDFGLYQRRFHGDERQYFFGMRFKLGKSPQRNR